jgi:hypothetical protein
MQSRKPAHAGAQMLGTNPTFTDTQGGLFTDQLDQLKGVSVALLAPFQYAVNAVNADLIARTANASIGTALG